MSAKKKARSQVDAVLEIRSDTESGALDVTVHRSDDCGVVRAAEQVVEQGLDPDSPEAQRLMREAAGCERTNRKGGHWSGFGQGRWGTPQGSEPKVH